MATQMINSTMPSLDQAYLREVIYYYSPGEYKSRGVIPAISEYGVYVCMIMYELHRDIARLQTADALADDSASCCP